MADTEPESTYILRGGENWQLRHLSVEQLLQIERYLDEIGEFGELHLIIEKNQVRFVEIVRSHKLP